MSEESFIQHDVENKQLKEENEKLRKENENEKLETRNEKLEMTNENKQFEKNKIIKEEPKEIKSPNWIDKNKFKEILAIIDSNEFNYKNKIGEFKYIDIKDLVNNIRNNTISEIDVKKDLNKLNEIKNAETIKYTKHNPGYKKLLNFFNDLLNIILTDKSLELGNQENKNESEQVESRKEEIEDEDYENQNEYENEDKYYENEDDDETMDQNKIIKGLNDNLDEIIDKSKSFEEQIELLEKLEDVKGYWHYGDYDDKELKPKYFKTQLADMSNEIDEKLFEQIFGHTLIKLPDKLINTKNKEENQVIVKNIEKSKGKLLEMVDFNDWVIQPNSQHIDLLNTIKLILNFNEDQLDLV